ncbi:hypothetical protein PAPHI01_2037 [Pancytospora philotis]|nr:hypothetical protein PAPHI01_2037 [Pancytospora philotis]
MNLKLFQVDGSIRSKNLIQSQCITNQKSRGLQLCFTSTRLQGTTLIIRLRLYTYDKLISMHIIVPSSAEIVAARLRPTGRKLRQKETAGLGVSVGELIKIEVVKTALCAQASDLGNYGAYLKRCVAHLDSEGRPRVPLLPDCKHYVLHLAERAVKQRTAKHYYGTEQDAAQSNSYDGGRWLSNPPLWDDIFKRCITVDPVKL